jgi:hypothetical protein
MPLIAERWSCSSGACNSGVVPRVPSFSPPSAAGKMPPHPRRLACDARRRLFFDLRPAFLHPLVDRLVIALAGLNDGRLRTPPQGAQEFAHLIAMIAYATLTDDHVCDSAGRPDLTAKSVMLGAALHASPISVVLRCHQHIIFLLTSAQRNTLQSATADFVAQPLGARMVLPINIARSLSFVTPRSVVPSAEVSNC